MRLPSRSGATLVATLLLLAPCFTTTATATDAPPCTNAAATIHARRGRVELLRAGSEVWIPAEIDDVLCHGDQLRTGSDGDVVWRTPDGNEHRLRYDHREQNGHAEFPQPEEEKSFMTRLLGGWIYVLSRDPREIGVLTLFANGGPEGTEFIVSVDDAGTDFETLDGAVLVSSSAGIRRVGAGETLRVGADGDMGAGAAEPALLPWAYFPRIVTGPLPLPDAEPARGDDADFFVLRAAARLEVGAVADALADLDRAAAIDPSDARIDAQRAIVALVTGEQAQAEAFVVSALAASPNGIEALLASSHVRQASNGARSVAVSEARRASELDSTNSLAWTRLAEAYLAAGSYRASAIAALEATSVGGDSAEAFTALGFARYAQRQLDEALAAFDTAMSLGSMSPHTWHGAALALWQQGRRTEAREAAELALILDPSSVDTRSALARFYDAEARRMLSGEQLALAELLTPSDPTPLLVRSYQEQSSANPIAALLEYRAATQRNAGRPPTRATFPLAPDFATESFGLARIFIDNDALELGNAVMRKKLAEDPLSPAAHQMSADLAVLESFSQPVTLNDSWNHELLTPSIESPSTLQRDQELSPNVRVWSPRAVTSSDDLRLNQDGLEGSVSVLGGSREIAGISASLAFRAEQNSLSFGLFENRSGGFGPNQASEQRGGRARLKYAPDLDTSFVFDISSFESVEGDVVFQFFPNDVGPDLRVMEETDTFRFGWRRETQAVRRKRPERNGTLLLSAFVNRSTIGAKVGSAMLEAPGRQHSLSARYVLQTDKYVFDFGAAFARTTLDTMPVLELRDAERKFYAYADRKLLDWATLTLGINFDERDSNKFPGSEVNGKIALVLEPTERMTWRMAYTEAARPPGASTTRNNGEPDLERTRIAGFSQLVYPNIDRTRTRLLAVDREFSARVFGGIAFRERSLARPIFVGLFEPRIVDLDEQVKSAHLYWLASSTVSLAVRYERDAYAAPPDTGTFTHFATRRATANVNWLLGHGVSASFRGAIVRQKGNFIVSGPPEIYAPGDTAFTLFDAGLSYRLPNRRTTVDFEVSNLFDEHFNYQEPEFDYMTFVRARTVFLSIQHLLR